MIATALFCFLRSLFYPVVLETLFAIIADHQERDRNIVYDSLVVIMEFYESRLLKQWIVERIARDSEVLQRNMQALARNMLNISSVSCQRLAFDVIHLHWRQLLKTYEYHKQAEDLIGLLPVPLQDFVMTARSFKMPPIALTEGASFSSSLLPSFS